MKRWILLCSLTCAALVWTPLLHAAADNVEPGEPDRMTAKDLRLTSHVSRVIFATQAAERAEVESLGLEDLEAELQSLRREIDGLAFAEARSEVVSSLPGSPIPIADDRVPQRERMNASLSRLASKRAALQARLGELKSPRQRRLLGRALEKLADLDQQARAAAAAPTGQRARRLARLKDRLVLERFGPAEPGPSDAPSPTFQMIPEDRLPQLAVD